MSHPTNQDLDQAVSKLGALLQGLKGKQTITAEILAALAEGMALIAKGLQQMDQTVKQIASAVESTSQTITAIATRK